MLSRLFYHDITITEIVNRSQTTAVWKCITKVKTIGPGYLVDGSCVFLLNLSILIFSSMLAWTKPVASISAVKCFSQRVCFNFTSGDQRMLYFQHLWICSHLVPMRYLIWYRTEKQRYFEHMEISINCQIVSSAHVIFWSYFVHSIKST
jgi:hypothetical protein